MNPQRARNRWSHEALASLLLIATCSSVLSAMEPQPAGLPTALELALDRIEPKLEEEERAHVTELFAGSEALLAHLPMADLRRITFGEGWLELGFDFGKDGSKELQIPGVKKSYWDAKKKKVVTEKSKEESVLLKSCLRILLDAQGICGIRQGDLSGKRYWKYWELTGQIVRERRVERDSAGNPRVVTDARGKAVLADGKPVLHTCDRWLVLEAKGNEIAVALE